MSEQEESTPAAPPSGEDQLDTPASESRPASGPASGKSSAAPLLMGVKLPIRVLLGRTELCLRDIAQLGNGAVVELDCSPDDPVEIIVNDRIIAHGEVVVVAGNYGVRITKIASRGESPQEEGGAADLFRLSDKLR
jgi:flagellar motor switch protein FliN/FliY